MLFLNQGVVTVADFGLVQFNEHENIFVTRFLVSEKVFNCLVLEIRQILES